MADSPKLCEFTPSGGMNQDDSPITPAVGLEGSVSLFQNGDYRYALNMRIGSSREDTSGDGEALKSSRKIEGYWATEGLFENSDFSSGLDEWLQPFSPFTNPWVYSSGLVMVELNNQPSRLMYQAIPVLGSRTVSLKYRYTVPVVPSGELDGFEVSAVFMDDTTPPFASQVFDEDNTPGVHEGTVTLNLPEGTTYLSISISGMADVSGVFLILSELQLYGYVASSMPAGTNKVIGKYKDYEFLRIYQAVYNSNGDHVLRYYDLLTDATHELIRWEGFNWTEDTFVKMAKLDNWLSLTERQNGNSPRLVDIDTIADTFVVVGAANFREFHISFHKWAPVAAPIIKRYYDGSTDNEYLHDKSIQFSYRYLYKGNLRSRWSPFSTAHTPYQSFSGATPTRITSISVYIPGLFLNEDGVATEFNYFNNDHANIVAQIEKIQLAFREGETGIWRLWKTIDPTTDAQQFTGDANNIPIATQDIFQPFDTVPFQSGTVEAIDNRFILADNLEEIDQADGPIITDVSVASAFGEEDESTGTWNTITSSLFTGVSALNRDEIAERNNSTQRTFKSRGLYKLGIQYLMKNGYRTLVSTSDNWTFEIPSSTNPGFTEQRHALNFKFGVGFKPPQEAVAYQIMRTNCLNIDSFLYGTCNSIEPIVDDVTSFLSGVANANPDMKKAFLDHFLNSYLITGKDFDDGLNVLENNSVFNSAVRFMRKSAAASAVTDASRLFIDIRNWWMNSKKDASGATGPDNLPNNLYYNYRPGDRVRFVASTLAGPNPATKSIFDAEILEFTGDGIIIAKPEEILWVPQLTVDCTPTDFLIEVYTPKKYKEKDFIFYESGEWYPVLFPNTDQRDWSKSDWTYTNIGAITDSTYGDFTIFNKQPFYLGDCHFIAKDFYNDFRAATPGGTGYSGKITSMYFLSNDTYKKWEHSIGRQSAAYTQLPVVKFKQTQARFTGKIVEESFINNINQMRDEDQFIYPSEYGRIRNMAAIANPQLESVGAVLLIVGEREAWSVYVNRTTLTDLGGRNVVSLSDKVLGSFNVLNGSHGTFNPESLTVDKTRAYWWDAINGEWIRYGRDGLTAISRNKMKSWFKGISNLIFAKYVSDEIPKVISGYDPFNDELLTFINHSTLPASFRDYAEYKGSVFSENDVRWKGCHSLNPEMFAHLGNKVFMFLDGETYIHEEGEDYRTLLGVLRDVKIEPVFNAFMKDMKVWETMAVVSTDKWSAERILSEYRGQKTIQLSNIPLSEFDDLEDVYSASILKDVNTPVTLPLIEGKEMRSKALKVLLKLDNDVTTRTLLHYVVAGYIMSQKTLTSGK